MLFKNILSNLFTAEENIPHRCLRSIAWGLNLIIPIYDYLSSQGRVKLAYKT